MPERSLYPLIENVLRRALPSVVKIDTEAPLKRLAPGAQAPCTDISIRSLAAYAKKRLDDKEQSVFIEVKSVFHGEHLNDADILADLAKLVRCENAYQANCFFMLVGLPADLARHDASSTLALQQAAGKMDIPLPSGGTAWLAPSASSVVGDVHIHVWSVSSNRLFGAGSSYYRYTLFQHKPF